MLMRTRNLFKLMIRYFCNVVTNYSPYRFVLYFQIVSLNGQLFGQNRNAVALSSRNSVSSNAISRGHTHIIEIDVKCEPKGMIVSIEFEEAFDGIVYSRGYHNDPKCRYVTLISCL